MTLFLHVYGRATAKQYGLKTYFTGKTCKNGHIDVRNAETGKCLTCIQVWKKSYRDDPVQGARIKDLKKESRLRNIEHITRYAKEYHESNKERINRELREKRNENREHYRSLHREWSKANPDNRRAKNSRMKVARKTRLVEFDQELTKFVEQEAAELCRLREDTTSIAWHLDHVVPLCAKTVSGLHYWANFQVIPAALNCSKRHKLMYLTPSEWIAEL